MWAIKFSNSVPLIATQVNELEGFDRAIAEALELEAREKSLCVMRQRHGDKVKLICSKEFNNSKGQLWEIGAIIEADEFVQITEVMRGRMNFCPFIYLHLTIY